MGSSVVNNHVNTRLINRIIVGTHCSSVKLNDCSKRAKPFTLVSKMKGDTPMPRIHAQGRQFTCDSGANLRQVLLTQGVEVYNGAAKTINCRGIGTCGTCAVAIQGEVSQLGWREQARLSLPPHVGANSLAKGRRLSCQVQVLGDLSVTKYDGFWGQGDRSLWDGECCITPSESAHNKT
jgi:ferredoxin